KRPAFTEPRARSRGSGQLRRKGNGKPGFLAGNRFPVPECVSPGGRAGQDADRRLPFWEPLPTSRSWPTADDSGMRRPMPRPRSPHAALLCGLCLAAPLAGCKGRGGGPLARAEPVDDAFAHVPVPPADGPKLFALPAGASVFDRPSTAARKIGELRVGAAVARSRDPITRSDCEGGWYAVRPRGFVCVGPGATLDPTVVS